MLLRCGMWSIVGAVVQTTRQSDHKLLDEFDPKVAGDYVLDVLPFSYSHSKGEVCFFT